MTQNFQRNPYGDEHPFDKVFSQIEDLLAKMESNKHKSLEDVPNWVFNELQTVEKEFERFQKVVTQTTPSDIVDEREFNKMVSKMPEDLRPVEADLVEKAKKLKEKAEEIHKDYYTAAANAAAQKNDGTSENSPMALLGKDKSEKDKDKEEEIKKMLEHKKKYGRMGGRKNWRPM